MWGKVQAARRMSKFSAPRMSVFGTASSAIPAAPPRASALGGMLSFLENRYSGRYDVEEELTLKALLQQLENNKMAVEPIVMKPRRGGERGLDKAEFRKLVAQLLKPCPMWTAKIVQQEVDRIFDDLDTEKTGKLDVVEVRRVLQPWKNENLPGSPSCSFKSSKKAGESTQGQASKSPPPKKTARVTPAPPGGAP